MRQRKPAQFKHFLLLLFMMLLIILSGCVSKSHWVWENPDKPTELEFLKDKKVCRDLAQAETARSDYYYYDFYNRFDYPFYAPYRHNHRVNNWPFYSGFYSDFNNYRFFQRQDDLERFYRICMKAKGWELIRVEKEKE